MCLRLIVENEVQWVWKVESGTAEIAGCKTDNPPKTTTKLDMYINTNNLFKKSFKKTKESEEQTKNKKETQEEKKSRAPAERDGG